MTDEMPALTSEDVNRLLQEHEILWVQVKPLAEDTNKKVTFLLDDMYGVPKQTPAHPEGDLDQREHGRLDKLDEMYSAFTNGGIKVKIPTGAWALMGTIVTVLGGILIALLIGQPSL